QLPLVERAGAVPRRAQDHVFQGQAQGQELAHDVEHVEHACVHAVGVQVGGDGVGDKAFLDDGDGDAPGETAAAVADVEEDAAAAADGQARIGPARRSQLVAPAGIDVGVDVAGAQPGGQQLFEPPLRKVAAEIDHHRD